MLPVNICINFATKLFLYLYIFNFVKSEKCGPLFLTVSAHTECLVLNWKFTCTDQPDSIIYGMNNVTLGVISVTNQSSGTYETEQNFNRSEITQETKCFPFWIKSLHNGFVVDEKCLNVEPAWMERFGTLRIGTMMILGTHNSGAFTGSTWGTHNYVRTQNKPFWKQLLSGIRYFDIRIGYLQREMWIYHENIKCTKLEPEWLQIKRFLDIYPKQVVILDFHDFTVPSYFTDMHHKELLLLIYSTLGDHILHPHNVTRNDEGPTLEEIWSINKRAIITYANIYQVRTHSWLWKAVSQKWGDKQDLHELYQYARSVASDHSHYGTPFCALMVQLTPTFIFQNPLGSLKKMADQVNVELNRWLREEDWVRHINIVTADFYMSSDIINIAIEMNVKKQKVEECRTRSSVACDQ